MLVTNFFDLPLISIVWMTFLKISYFMFQKKVSHTGLERHE